MQFKDAAATRQLGGIGNGPFPGAGCVALLCANPLRGDGRE